MNENSPSQSNTDNTNFVDQERFKSFQALKLNSLEECNKAAVEFGTLQVHIASALLAFTAAGSLINSTANDSHVIYSLPEQILLISSWILLISSLFLGLLSSHLKQLFFKDDIKNKAFCTSIWRDYLENKISKTEVLKIVEDFQKGYPLASPDWPWITQTVFLFLGTIALFVFVGLHLF